MNTETELKLISLFPPKVRKFPQIRFMGSKYRLLPWMYEILARLEFDTVALSAIIRSSVKRQPRGVFTVAGEPERYKDGRKDLKLSLREHFVEQGREYNRAVFDNGRENIAVQRNVFNIDPRGFDLVYIDPPYVPRSDDNCYIKRYHFLEGLSCYWEGVEILKSSKVKKIKKRYTPFSYRKTAVSAFDKMFERFSHSMLVLSYSSNGYPDLDILIELMTVLI